MHSTFHCFLIGHVYCCTFWTREMKFCRSALFLIFGSLTMAGCPNEISPESDLNRRSQELKQPASKLDLDKLLLSHLIPVSVDGCNLTRFGNDHDGGYLLCAG